MSPKEERRWEWEREGKPRDVFGLPDDGNPLYDIITVGGILIFVASATALAVMGAYAIWRGML